MKAGTTSLYEDLSKLPGIYMLPDKEPDALVNDSVLTPSGKANYLSLFKEAHPDDICGEASTSYTKMPDLAGVPARAVAILGNNLKVIYLRREPLARIVSHYKHLWGLNLEHRPLNEAVLDDDSYVNYSRYDYQLSFWRSVLPEKQILVLDFEEYVGAPLPFIQRIAAFLDVTEPQSSSLTHRNRSEDKSIVKRNSLTFIFLRSKFYQYHMKKWFSRELRDYLKASLLPRARSSAEVLSNKTRRELQKRLEIDATAN